MNWVADVYDSTMSIVDTKYFRPSNSLNRLFNMPSNSSADYSFLSVHKKVRFWLGESYYSLSGTREYYFAVAPGIGGIGQINKVATHYGLPVPYDDNLKDIIINIYSSII
jgi:hypothetical protein